MRPTKPRDGTPVYSYCVGSSACSTPDQLGRALCVKIPSVDEYLGDNVEGIERMKAQEDVQITIGQNGEWHFYFLPSY